MLNIDRHIAISAGWVAGPAFGVAMMAAPEYLHLGPVLAPLLFWGGIVVFLATIGVVAVISVHEEGERREVTGPIITMMVGALIFCGGAAWYFWLPIKPAETLATIEQPAIKINFESGAPYETSAIQNGHVLNMVRIGLKAAGRVFTCKVYIEKIAPEPHLSGGLPILLEGGDFTVRPNDPETLVNIASQWDHMHKFRFAAPIGAVYGGALNYLEDNIERTIEVKIVVGSEFQKTATFKIWTDASKKLHLKPT